MEDNLWYNLYLIIHLRNMTNIKEAINLSVGNRSGIDVCARTYCCLFINILRFTALLRHYRIWKWTTMYMKSHPNCEDVLVWLWPAIAYRENIEVTLSCVRDAISWILKALCVYVERLMGTVKEHEVLHTYALLIIYWAVSGIYCAISSSREIP